MLSTRHRDPIVKAIRAHKDALENPDPIPNIDDLAEQLLEIFPTTHDGLIELLEYTYRLIRDNDEDIFPAAFGDSFSTRMLGRTAATLTRLREVPPRGLGPCLLGRDRGHGADRHSRLPRAMAIAEDVGRTVGAQPHAKSGNVIVPHDGFGLARRQAELGDVVSRGFDLDRRHPAHGSGPLRLSRE